MIMMVWLVPVVSLLARHIGESTPPNSLLSLLVIIRMAATVQG
jgi:hypothetical protein